jgi:hypothetical protein
MASMLWLMPQKRGTFLLAGFIHGAIYDNWIPLDPGVVWARAAHACFGLSIFGFYAISRPLARKIICPLLLIAAAFCLVTLFAPVAAGAATTGSTCADIRSA